MEHRFPWREQYLARTRLCYVDLGRLLSHAKRDRSARVPGYVQVELGDAVHLLFLDAGEPVNAATVRPDSRTVVPLGSLMRTLLAESERGEAGYIAYYGVDPDQLRSMFATVAETPLEWAAGVSAAGLDRLFGEMHRRAADGVLEISGNGRTGYLSISSGLARRCFLGEGADADEGPEALRRFIAACDGALTASLHPPVGALPVQAPPGLAELYAAILAELTGRLAALLSPRELDELFDGARSRNGQAEMLSGFRRVDGDVVPGDAVATPEVLTDAIGEWMVDLASATADRTGIDPAELLAAACLRHRFVLEEVGLLQRFPWPLAWAVQRS